ncbi:amino acid ABC transporter substrate-binding protein (PAAT family) [Tamilnaduibacter salinus]|uniref:Amino acid ABC transporter substrate-binding protein (PAAT family) n=1 Tax=Tamilnaduibacter salinus TaxID=1484056 RepID=A0A2U1D037_9GAMM|nr:transporter substrate-binding domain-containing protein [Tamilnaduibacter salinus]PVY78387.1 amino acid ABC transporter substrate-binding protein (PAAT family) [Tamilnaduibacter salinus]
MATVWRLQIKPVNESEETLTSPSFMDAPLPFGIAERQMMSKPIKHALFALVLILAVWVSIANAAQSRHSDLSQTHPIPEVIRFNVSPDGYPPYIIVDDTSDKSVEGIVWDIVHLACQRLGCRLKPRRVPRKRLESLLLKDYVNVTAMAPLWMEDPDKYLFSNPLVPIREVLFFRAGDRFAFESPDDIKGKTIVTHIGYRYPAVQHLFRSGQAKRFDVPQDKDMFRYLLHGSRFDALIADNLVGRWLMEQNQWDGQFVVSDNHLSRIHYRLMVRPDMKGFIDAFNQVLSDLKDTGKIKAIIQRYL